MHHILAAAPHVAGWQHALSVIGHFLLKFIVVIMILLTAILLVARGGLNWLHGVIVLVMGMLLVVAFLPAKAVSFIGQVNHGSTVKTTGATIGELVVLGVLFILAIFSTRG
jgi:hypothetical protein